MDSHFPRQFCLWQNRRISQILRLLPPLPVFAKILRISGRGNCKDTIFALENGIFRRKNPPIPAVHAAGDDFCTNELRPLTLSYGFFDSLEGSAGSFVDGDLPADGLRLQKNLLAGTPLYLPGSALEEVKGV